MKGENLVQRFRDAELELAGVFFLYRLRDFIAIFFCSVYPMEENI